MTEGAFEIGTELMKYIFVSFAMIVFTFSYGYAVTRYQEVDFDVGDLNADLLMRRIFYSSECFGYEESGRAYFGELEKKKINSERLKDCIPEDSLVKIRFESTEEIFYNNEENFNKGLCKFKDKYSCYSGRVYLMIRNGNEITFDNVLVEVIKNL